LAFPPTQRRGSLRIPNLKVNLLNSTIHCNTDPFVNKIYICITVILAAIPVQAKTLYRHPISLAQQPIRTINKLIARIRGTIIETFWYKHFDTNFRYGLETNICLNLFDTTPIRAMSSISRKEKILWWIMGSSKFQNWSIASVFLHCAFLQRSLTSKAIVIPKILYLKRWISSKSETIKILILKKQ